MKLLTKDEFIEWYYSLELLTYGEISDIEVLTDIKQILKWKNNSIFISTDIPEDTFTVKEYWLYLSLLSKCIDYGTSPRGAWLTELGLGILNYLETYSESEWLYDIPEE